MVPFTLSTCILLFIASRYSPRSARSVLSSAAGSAARPRPRSSRSDAPPNTGCAPASSSSLSSSLSVFGFSGSLGTAPHGGMNALASALASALHCAALRCLQCAVALRLQDRVQSTSFPRPHTRQGTTTTGTVWSSMACGTGTRGHDKARQGTTTTGTDQTSSMGHRCTSPLLPSSVFSQWPSPWSRPLHSTLMR